MARPRTFCSRPATRPGKHTIPGADIICIKVRAGTNSDRAYAVSYNRPIAMNSTANLAGPQDFLFGEEYAAIYWLEQNGYDRQLHLRHRCRNQSRAAAQYQGLHRCRSRRILVAIAIRQCKGCGRRGCRSRLPERQSNLLGYRARTEFRRQRIRPTEPSWNTRTFGAGRSSIRTGRANGGAGLFRDPVYGPGTPENSLSGTIFTVDDFGTLDNISIPASMSQLRFWSKHQHRQRQRWNADPPARLRVGQRSRQWLPASRT